MMEKEDIIDLLEIPQRDYDNYFLKKNPFPQMGIPGIETPFTVDREKIKKQFVRAIGELRTNKRGSVTVLVGDYGNGKTHLLKVFKENINSQLLSLNSGATLAIYVQSPGEEFEDLFYGIIEDIGRSLLLTYSQKIIRQYYFEHKQEFLRLIKDGTIRESLDNKNSILSETVIGELIQNSQYNVIFRNIKEKYFGDVHSNDIIYAFLGLSHPIHSWRAWRWFLGEPLDKSDKEVFNFESTIKDSKIAYDILKDFLLLLNDVGISSIVVLVDELEKITLLHPSKRTKYQDYLRQIIDDLSQNTVFYFAIAYRQWNILYQEATALTRRLESNWYVLDNFTRDETELFIKKFLYYGRSENYSSEKAFKKFPKCETALCPFTNDSIDAIYTYTKGKLSKIIVICSKLLEFLIDNQDEYNLITKDMVEKVVREEQRYG